jgi:hypothetical protein
MSGVLKYRMNKHIGSDEPAQNLSCRLHDVLLHSIGYNFNEFQKDSADREAVRVSSTRDPIRAPRLILG